MAPPTVTTRVLVCALLGLPAGWLVGVVVDRVPGARPLFRPVEPVRLSGLPLALLALTTALFGAAGWRLGGLAPSALAGYLFLLGVLVAVSAIDVAHLRLPDAVVLPALATSVALVVGVSLVEGDVGAAGRAGLGAATYFASLLLVHLVHPPGMGFGDVKLAALMGLYVGWLGATPYQSVQLVLWAMLVGFVAGSVVGLALLAVRRRNLPMPFGPFLALGTTVVVLVGPAPLA